MSIPEPDFPEDYAALRIFRQSQMNTLVAAIEEYITDNIITNFNQLRLDILGSDYTFNNDGVQTRDDPLVDSFVDLTSNQEIDGAKQFLDNVIFLEIVTFDETITGTNQTRARAYRTTSNQSLADDTLTAVSMAAETYDFGDVHSNSSNPTRMTVPLGKGGTYMLVAHATFDGNATGRREIHIYKNGSSIGSITEFSPDATTDTRMQIVLNEELAAADYLEMFVYQNSGGALDIVNGERNTFFSILKVW